MFRRPLPSILQPDLLENIGAMLSKASLHEKAGDFFEHLGQLERARDSYRAGGAYKKAVDLARRAFPGQVRFGFRFAFCTLEGFLAIIEFDPRKQMGITSMNSSDEKKPPSFCFRASIRELKSDGQCTFSFGPICRRRMVFPS